MSYIDDVGIIVIGGTSTPAGKIEVFDEENRVWHIQSEAESDKWNPDVVKLPVEYKYMTVTKQPECHNCNGLMLFGGFGCEPGYENCGHGQDSYVSYTYGGERKREKGVAHDKMG